MLVLALFALKLKRPYNSGLSLVAAAAIMLVWQPLFLGWDIGFQLSFAATAGVVFILPIFNKLISQKNYLQYVLPEPVLATLAAAVFTLPVIVWHFGVISLVSPLANLLVIPAIPLLMFGSILLFTPLNVQIINSLVANVAQYIIAVASYGSSFYGASRQISGLWFVSIYIILLGLAVWIFVWRNEKHQSLLRLGRFAKITKKLNN